MTNPDSLETIPFALPDITDREIESVVHCLKSGWLTTGPNAKAFEAAFSARMGGGIESIAVNSCTAGLLLALEAFGIGEGDEVITTTNTFTATAMTIYHAGAKPVLVDIDPRTMNMDPNKIEAAITPRTKAIIPVHFAGLSCDMDAIRTIARRHNLRIIVDAAHALPTTYKGEMVGSAASADATAFSFYATKTITSGEGGMITVADPEIAAKCRTLRLHGINRDVFNRYTSVAASWYYEVVAPGHKCNLTDMAASIGLIQLDRMDEMHGKRCAMQKKYHEAFADLPVQLPAGPLDGDIHAWHLYVLRLTADAGLSRDAFIEKMQAAKIGCSVHFIPLHRHPFWRDLLNVSDADFPEATKAFEHAVSIPFYSAMSQAQIDRVCETVRTIFKQG